MPLVLAAVLVAVLGVAPVAVGELVLRGSDAGGTADAVARNVAQESQAATGSGVAGRSEAELARTSAARAERVAARRIARVAAAAAREQARQQARQAQRARARAAARRAREARRAEQAQQSAPFAVRIGTFNVLGSQHTAPGGDRPHFPPASVRSARAADLIAKHGVDIVGTQELQDDQLRALQSRTGMAAYPGLAWGAAETDNSILYDPDRFELVSGSKFVIPFMGRPRPQPIVRLEDRATGRQFYVVNTHPSAHDGRYLVERRRGQATLVDIVDQLQESGLPVLVTGDMNDREEFYCRVVAPAGLLAPNGGSYSGGCQPPPSPIPVDWVVGSGVTWSDYWRDTAPVTDKTSDHFFVSATAHVG